MSTVTDFHEEAVARQPPLATPYRYALRKAANIATTVLLITAVGALLVVAVGFRIFGYQSFTLLSGSMAPLINPGDVVVTKSIPLQDLKAGDIITYNIPVEDKRTVTHRVSEIFTEDDGALAVRTKGDANPNPDYWTPVLNGPNVSKQVFTIPHVGSAIQTFREPVIRYTLLYGAPMLCLALYLIPRWRKPRTRPKDGLGSTGTTDKVG